MFINLAWSNANTGSVTTNIYRGTAELNRASLSNPIATLTNGEKTYKDTTVTAGVTYYYVIEFVSAGVKVSTRNYSVLAQYVRGHGNPVVMLGDDNYGFMDYVSFGRTVSTLTALGISTAGITDGAMPASVKFSYQGKVVFAVPFLTTNIAGSWNALSPLLNNDTGLPVTIDGFQYIVRLPKVMPATWDNASRPTSADYPTDFIKLCLSQFNILAPNAGETLGKVNTLPKANNVVGRETNGGYACARVPSTGVINWLPLANAPAGYAILLFELVD